MPSIKTPDPCIICNKNFAIMHSHHTIPQARGGKDSPQVILDPSCHNALHAHALWLYAQLKKPKETRETKTFWPCAALEQKAMPLVHMLVKAFLEPCANSKHILSVEVDGNTLQDFKLLAADLGCSQENALRFCIHQVLIQRGIKRETNSRSKLWFLHSSKQ